MCVEFRRRKSIGNMKAIWVKCHYDNAFSPIEDKQYQVASLGHPKKIMRIFPQIDISWPRITRENRYHSKLMV